MVTKTSLQSMSRCMLTSFLQCGQKGVGVDYFCNKKNNNNGYNY